MLWSVFDSRTIFVHAQIDQDLRADAVVAQRAGIRRRADDEIVGARGKARRHRLAQYDDDAPSRLRHRLERRA